MQHDHASVNAAHGSHDHASLTSGPCTFIVDGRTYTGTYGGQFLDDAGNELPYDVGVALFDRSTEEERASRASSAPGTGERVSGARCRLSSATRPAPSLAIAPSGPAIGGLRGEDGPFAEGVPIEDWPGADDV